MLQKNNIRYIAVPFRSGANREGTQYAPAFLLNRLSLPKNICTILPLNSEETPLNNIIKNGVYNYDEVLYMRNQLQLETYKTINECKRTIILGGDHSISIGSIAGVLKKYPNIGVIWVDAHTDINTENTSYTGNVHGMSLASLIGICESEINTSGIKLNPLNVFWVGVRDIDDGEWEIIQRLNIESHVFTCDRIHKLGIENVMKQIFRMFKKNGVENIHISFDIDVMDPSIVKATGTPVQYGLSEYECDRLIQCISDVEAQNIVAVDFVEYNPLLDDVVYHTGQWCVSKLKKIVTILGK